MPSRLIVPLITPVVLALLTATIRPNDSADGPEPANAIDPEIPMSLPLTLTMTAVFLGTLAACLDISGERPIYLRERAVNLRIPIYVVSKLPALFMLTIVQCFLFVTITTFFLRRPEVNALHLALACTALAWVSCAIGLFISSLDPTSGQNSVMLAIVVVLPQMILCGAMHPTYYDGMNAVAKALACGLPARWGFEWILSIVYPDKIFRENFIRGQMGFGYGSDILWKNGAALVSLGLAYFTATCFSVKRYDRL